MTKANNALRRLWKRRRTWRISQVGGSRARVPESWFIGRIGQLIFSENIPKTLEKHIANGSSNFPLDF